MSRKLLIGWCLIPLLSLSIPSIFAQKEPVSILEYHFINIYNNNFSVQAWLPANVSLFSQNQFLLQELCTATLSGSYNIKENSVAVAVSHFGYSKYGIFTLSAGYAKLFTKRISFALQTHYILHHAEGYPNLSSFTFDLSLYGRLSPKVGIGVSAYNPANLKYGLTGKEKIPMLYCLMLDYKINDKLLLALTTSKQLPGAFDIIGTICFKDKFYGFMMDFSLKSVGTQFSFWWKKLQFDMGGSFDYRVGFSPWVRVGFCY